MVHTPSGFAFPLPNENKRDPTPRFWTEKFLSANIHPIDTTTDGAVAPISISTKNTEKKDDIDIAMVEPKVKNGLGAEDLNYKETLVADPVSSGLLTKSRAGSKNDWTKI